LKARLLPFLGFLSIAPSHADSSLTLSTGIDYSSGKYGEAERTETLVIPIGIKYEFGDWTLRATIPYVESTGPSNVSGSGPDRVAINSGENTRRKAAGLGDIVLSASWNAFQDGPWLIELGAKAKLPTADKNEGLGTGKTDYSVQTEVYRTLGSSTLFGTLGYKRMGDPEGTDLKDPFFTSVGWSYKTSPVTALGLSYDYRQKIQDSGAPLRDATAFLTHKLDQHWKLQGYLVTGFSKASPDMGGGIFVFYSY
jgi:hypothetical protein